MTYQVEIDKDACISSGKCVADAPTVFRFDDDELSDVIQEHPSLPDAQLEQIAENCPVGAVLLSAASQPSTQD